MFAASFFAHSWYLTYQQDRLMQAELDASYVRALAHERASVQVWSTARDMVDSLKKRGAREEPRVVCYERFVDRVK